MTSFAVDQRDSWMKRFGRRIRLLAPDDRGALQRLREAQSARPGSSLPGNVSSLVMLHAQWDRRTAWQRGEWIGLILGLFVVPLMMIVHEHVRLGLEVERWSLHSILLWLGCVALVWLVVIPVAHVFSPLVERLQYRQSLRKADLLCSFGICPCCGQMFDREPPAADGIIECPACSAAWRADRLQPAMVAALRRVMREPRSGQVQIFSPSTWLKFQPLGTKDLVDDRRIACTLRFWKTAPLWVEDGSGEIQAKLTRIYESHAKSGRESRQFLAIIAFVATAIAIGLLASMVLENDTLPILIGLAALCLVVPTVVGLLILKTRQGADWFEFKHTSLMERLCPVCTSSLDQPAPEDDGCTVWPTCKAAWDMQTLPRA